MPVRAPIDLTDVEVDFSAIGTTGSHSSTTTTTAATAVTSASATRANVAALLASAGGRAEGDKDAASNNGEDGGGGSGAAAAAAAASRAYDPAMQTYMQRHLQQQQRRRQRGMSFFAPSKVTDTTAAAAEEEATAPPPQQRVRIEAHTGATPALVATRTNDNSNNSNGNASTAQRTHGGDGDNSDDAAALFVAEATSAGQPGVTRARHRAYLRALRRLCRHDASTAAGDDDEDDNDDNDTAAAATTATVTTAHALLASPARAFSMLQQLFDDGVPDVEPWDQWAFAVPRYDVHALVTNNSSSSSSKDAHELVRYVHHAVLPDSHYTTHYQHRDEDAAAVAQRAREQQQQLQRMQTPKERRAERRAKQQAKQQAARAVAAAAALPASAVTTSSSSSSSTTTTTTAADGSTATLTSAPVRDRLSTRALALQLFTRSVLNPLAAETRVLDQYEQRYIEHQRRNHERHVAALPAQVAKRARDVARHARERPLLRVYRVCRVYTPAQLAMLRHFANDQRLRGFVLWVAQCDALIVLAGGEVALRHLDQWIVTKMQWHDAATRARRLCTVALPDAHTFSFHRKGRKTATAATAAAAATAADAEAAHESVFLSFVDTVEQGEAFMRTVVPAPGSPWRDMSAVWRLAFLADGLAVRRA